MQPPLRASTIVAACLTAVALLGPIAASWNVGTRGDTDVTPVILGPPNTSQSDPGLPTQAVEPSIFEPDAHNLVAGPSGVLWTLNLENGSLFAGNVVPHPCSFAYTSLAVAPSLGSLFVTCVGPDGTGSLLAFDTSSGLARYDRPLGTDPTAVTFDPSTNEVYVANNGSDNMSVVSAASGTLVATLPVTGGPDSIAYDNLTENLYVTSYRSGNVTEIAPNQTVVRVIHAGAGTAPVGVVYDPVSNLLAVAEDGPDQVGMIGADNGSVVANLTVEGQPLAIGCNPESGDIYVGTYLATDLFNHLAVISGVPPRVVSNLAVGFDPDSVTYASDSDRIYVADGYPYNVSVINASSNTVIGSITAAAGPIGIAYDNASARVYLAESAGNVAVINQTQETISQFISLDPGPQGVAWDPATNNMYTSTRFSGVLDEVASEGNQLLDSRSLWYGLGGVAANSGTGDLYVTCWSCATLYNVSAEGALLGSISVGEWPTTAAYDSRNGLVFVSNFDSNTVSLVDSRSDAVASTVCLSSGICINGNGAGGGPDAVAFDTFSGDVYVAVHGDVNGDPGNVTLLNGTTGAPIGDFNVPPWGAPGPTSLLVDLANNELYVADDWSDLLWAFNLTTEAVISEIPVGSSPQGIALDPLNGLVYVTNAASDNISVINSSNNEVAGSIAVGLDPTGIAFDPTNGWIYAANSGSGTLSIIGEQTYSVTFFESGLPNATNWSVTLGNLTNWSTSSATAFAEPNGTYGYTVPRARGYVPSPAFGSVVVNGSAKQVLVSFLEPAPPSYQISFIEAGLPSGTNWSVSVEGRPFYSVSSTILVLGANGTYPYFVGEVQGYAATPSSGNVTLSGGNQSVRVSFTQMGSTASGPDLLGLGLPDWVIFGGTAAFTASVALTLLFRRRHPPPPVRSYREPDQEIPTPGSGEGL